MFDLLCYRFFSGWTQNSVENFILSYLNFNSCFFKKHDEEELLEIVNIDYSVNQSPEDVFCGLPLSRTVGAKFFRKYFFFV